MKNCLFALAFILFTAGVNAQTKDHKLGITSGAYIQHYKGNLGNSFFDFNDCCFAGEVVTLGYYLDKTFDFNFSASLGDYGYWASDAERAKPLPFNERCPGCPSTGMRELRSRMFAGNIALKYKFANGTVFKEDSKVAPYLYAGVGVNHLADRMKKQCVNVGTHLSLNAGLGFKYNVTERINVGYNLGLGCFTKEKVYATVSSDEIQMDGKKDMYMQNTLFVGMNF